MCFNQAILLLRSGTIFSSSNFQQYFHGSFWFQGHCLWTATGRRSAHITAEQWRELQRIRYTEDALRVLADAKLPEIEGVRLEVQMRRFHLAVEAESHDVVRARIHGGHGGRGRGTVAYHRHVLCQHTQGLFNRLLNSKIYVIYVKYMLKNNSPY